VSDADKIRILRKYTSRLVDRNVELIALILEINDDDMLVLLNLKRDRVYDDMHSLNDGKYMDRNKFIDCLDGAIELWGDLEGK